MRVTTSDIIEMASKAKPIYESERTFKPRLTKRVYIEGILYYTLLYIFTLLYCPFLFFPLLCFALLCFALLCFALLCFALLGFKALLCFLDCVLWIFYMLKKSQSLSQNEKYISSQNIDRATKRKKKATNYFA